MAFFGLIVQPKLKADAKLPAPLSITNAALPSKLADPSSNARSTLLVSVDEGDYIPICSLTPGTLEQHNMDLVLEMGVSVSFTVDGPNPIALAGFFHNDDEDMDDGDYATAMGMNADSEDEDDNEDESDENDDDQITVDETDEDDEEELEEEEEEEDGKKAEAVALSSALAEAKKKAAAEPKKKANAEAKKKENVETKTQAKVSEKPVVAALAKSSEKVVSVEAKKRKAEEINVTGNKEIKKAKVVTTTTQTLKGGLQLTDLVPADPTAPKAKTGQRVSMRYIGRLTNGKVFDQNIKGQPFSFKLGRGEVIKGWDMGIVGMAVGQRRKLVIPAKLAYGSRGAPPDIPANATLEFEVKLLSVK